MGPIDEGPIKLDWVLLASVHWTELNLCYLLFQEYEVPRAAVEAARAAAEAAAAAKFSSQSSQQLTTADSAEEENFYENTLTHSNKHRGLRESDIYIVEEAPKSSDYGSHGGDDRSSGYRSSSSPSIQVNNGLGLSAEIRAKIQ